MILVIVGILIGIIVAFDSFLPDTASEYMGFSLLGALVGGILGLMLGLMGGLLFESAPMQIYDTQSYEMVELYDGTYAELNGTSFYFAKDINHGVPDVEGRSMTYTDIVPLKDGEKPTYDWKYVKARNPIIRNLFFTGHSEYTFHVNQDQIKIN